MEQYNARKIIICSAWLALTALPVWPEPDFTYVPDRAFSLFFPSVIEARTLLLTIEHRGREGAFKHPFTDGFGLDNGGLKIGLGLRYGITSRLDAGVRRLNNVSERFDVYEFDGRCQVLKDGKDILDLSVMAGFTWFYQPDVRDASGFYGALLLGKGLGDRAYLSSGLLAHNNSTYASKYATDPDGSAAAAAALLVRPFEKLFLCAEGVFPLAGYSAGRPSYGAGFKAVTWGHTFSLLFSNTQYVTFDGLVSGAGRTGNPGLGFLITRKFGEGRTD